MSLHRLEEPVSKHLRHIHPGTAGVVPKAYGSPPIMSHDAKAQLCLGSVHPEIGQLRRNNGGREQNMRRLPAWD